MLKIKFSPRSMLVAAAAGLSLAGQAFASTAGPQLDFSKPSTCMDQWGRLHDCSAQKNILPKPKQIAPNADVLGYYGRQQLGGTQIITPDQDSIIIQTNPNARVDTFGDGYIIRDTDGTTRVDPFGDGYVIMGPNGVTRVDRFGDGYVVRDSNGDTFRTRNGQGVIIGNDGQAAPTTRLESRGLRRDR